jgi:hypothetical protein
MPLFFVYFSYFTAYIHSFDHIHTIHLSVAICRGLSPSPHRFVSSVGRPSCGAEPRIEPGPALQQADVLPTEPRRTISEPRRTIIFASK